MKTIVPEDWQIPHKIRSRFGETAGKQRIMMADGHLVMVLHEPPGWEDSERKARLLWRNPSGCWTWTSSGDTAHLLKKHIAGFAEKSERLESQLQNACCSSDYFALLKEVVPIHRTCRNLHAALQQAREAVPDDHELIVARDAASDLERAFELLHTDAKNGLDFLVALRAEEQSQRSYQMAVSAHRLNILAALFFPITAMSSVLGMNVVSGLELMPGATMFWTVLAVGLGAGVLLAQTISGGPVPDVGIERKPARVAAGRRSRNTVSTSKMNARSAESKAKKVMNIVR
jgi:hypothetical protein